MLVEVKSDAHVRSSEEQIREVQAEVTDKLERFARRTTRVEVFLSDSNANKSGIDKRCVMEAHVAGLQPLAVHHEAAQLAEAVTGAVEKLARSISKHVERLADRRGPGAGGGDGLG